MGQACPTGNGQIRGPEAAQDAGTPLPGSRPDRARANDAKHGDFLIGVVAEQGGFGTEDMECSTPGMDGSAIRPSDTMETPDLASMGDGGQTFGGM